MKKLMLLVLLFPMICLGQKQLLLPGKTEVTGFLGIPFGKSKVECISLMKAKGYNFEPSKNDYISFKSVQFGGRTAASVTLYFYKNQLSHGLVLVLPDRKPRILEEYDKMISSITEKYGDSESTRDFKSPYSEGDGDETMAIEGGYASIKDVWRDLGQGLIVGSITSSLIIRIDYYDKALTDQSLKAVKEKAYDEL